ncbi:MAG: tRNA (adenosine(37)-N6)-threonylcarbamoyltransferase complex ATPase subunit type 1 TsaE [Patescibacteria group bacterium]|nr:tRNA (adenosine(37)-N6)-threonylcarbamoyltransferase complex ATPase subunit type 1 TsaE [Patescibacteria group bacterium]MBU2508786.1 tRNA (adenosine(37)-N6)-threonylcarbamoyltransferase complex ATPase subunit type 1 TsaE [Patescibacteria group bacterium]
MRQAIITKGKTSKNFKIPTEKDWGDFAEHVVSELKPGDILALSGSLGAGKTTFVQALAGSLGIKKNIQSPTFALVRSYPISGHGKLTRLLHVDAYRIDDERDLMALDLDEELADNETALVLEWPENIKGWLQSHNPIKIKIS